MPLHHLLPDGATTARRPGCGGRTPGCEAHHLGGGPNDERLGVAWDDDHSVSKLNDALEAVLSKDDGDAEIVHEPLECGEHLLGRPWVERGGRLVEDEDLGMGGEDSADRHALLLPGR